jgi:hypothetical protein
MADNASRRGAVDTGVILMIVAFATIGGFMYWLDGQADAERAASAVVEEETPEEDLSVRTITADDVRMDATPLEGQEVRMASFNIASLLGTQGLWLAIPNGNPFLVSFSPAVMAEAPSVSPGAVATVTGVIHPMSDSTLTAWSTAGTIQEGDRVVAEFAAHYLEATDVRTRPGAPAPGPGDDDGGN